MKNVRKSNWMWVLALTLLVGACSNSGGGPTAPASFDETEEFSAEKKGGGGGGPGKDPSNYQITIGGLVPGTFDGFSRSGKLAIAKAIDCGLKEGVAGGLPLCPATFPTSDDIIEFLDTRFPGAGLGGPGGCLREILAFNDIVLVQPSNPDPDTFDLVIEFTARTVNNGKTNNNAQYSYVGQISRLAGELDEWPPDDAVGDQFDMITDGDDMVELVPGHKRNGCPAGPVLAVQNVEATILNVP